MELPCLLFQYSCAFSVTTLRCVACFVVSYFIYINNKLTCSTDKLIKPYAETKSTSISKIYRLPSSNRLVKYTFHMASRWENELFAQQTLIYNKVRSRIGLNNMEQRNYLQAIGMNFAAFIQRASSLSYPQDSATRPYWSSLI
jgi:hypothetical protein